MKKIFLYLSISICINIYIPVKAQNNKVDISITDGMDLVRILPNSQQFLIGEFTPSTIYFRDGKIYKSNLDYNLLLDEVVYLDSTGTLISLTELNKIHFITIKSHTLIYNPRFGFFEVIYPGNCSLIKKRKVIIKEKDGHVELPFGVTEAYKEDVKVKRFELGGDINDTYNKDKKEMPGELIYIQEYWVGKNDHVWQIKNEKSFLRLFPKSKQQRISNYIGTNKTNFSDESQLVGLIKYCNMLD